MDCIGLTAILINGVAIVTCFSASPDSVITDGVTKCSPIICVVVKPKLKASVVKATAVSIVG